MRKLVAALCATGITAVAAAPALGASVPLITGGAEDVVPGLNLTVNAIRHSDGDFSGKINYVYEPLDLHVVARVECANAIEVAGVGIGVAAGPQRDNPALWTLVWVEDYGDYDEITVQFVPAGQALNNCAAPQPLAAVPVTTNGEFHVRAD